MDDGKCDETKKERHYGVWDFGGGVLRLRSADVHFLAAAIHGVIIQPCDRQGRRSTTLRNQKCVMKQ